jgi:ankyrin repeat protein
LEDTTTSLLWLSGGAGCGKSVSTSFIIDTLLRRAGEDNMPVTICYYFCDDKNEAQRYATSALCGILHQLVSSKPSLIKYVLGPYQAKGRRITKELKTLWDILIAALADPAAENVMLIIDALDECEESTRQPFLDWISEFIKVREFENRSVKILMTSRPDFSIASKLGSPAVQLRMEDEIQNLERDIRIVVTKKLDGLAYSSDLTEEIENYLMEKADGTFLWVALTLHLLEESGDSSYEGLMDILHHAHSGNDLFNVYASILGRIPEDRRMEARKVLHIVATASRPLTLEEFNLALVIRPTDESEYGMFRRLQRDLPRFLLRLCGPFLRIVDERIHLVHKTAKEFLLIQSDHYAQSFWILDPAESHFLLAQICIWYLLFDCFTPRPRGSEASVISQNLMRTNTTQLSKPKEHLLLDYSATYWPMHFREGQKHADDEIIRKATRIHETSDPRFLKWFEIFWSASEFGGHPPDGVTPLISASIAGHESVAASLLSADNLVVNARDQTGSTSLLWASRTGHEAMVKFLIERDDVQVNSEDEDKRTPLWWAAWYGHRAVVETLLLRGDVEINSADIIHQTALLVAAWNGHDSIVELLLRRFDIKVDIKDREGYTPLARASSRNHVSVVRLLLAHGQTKPDSKDKDGRTPLSRAAERGHANIVELLIACTDTNCNSKDRDGRTSLSHAAEAGHVAVMKLLLDVGHAIADSKDDEGQTPLYWAAGEGQEAVVRLLMERCDVNVDSDYSEGQTPLSRAAERGQEEIVRLLLSRGDVNANAMDYDKKTPLWWAAEGGHAGVVKLLLAREDVDVNSKDSKGRTPLDIAEASCHVAVVKLLRNPIYAEARQERTSAETHMATEESASLDHLQNGMHAEAKQVEEPVEAGVQETSSERMKVLMKAIVSWWRPLQRSLKSGRINRGN